MSYDPGCTTHFKIRDGIVSKGKDLALLIHAHSIAFSRTLGIPTITSEDRLEKYEETPRSIDGHATYSS